MMETAVPPSYEEATARNPLALVARYIIGADLCSACLVSKRWHTIFSPWLWGNPAGHFGEEGERVYAALTRFKRTLPTARPQVRALTHTLHLPPAQSEIYDGPRADWLREVLEQLPHLQSLVVSQLPFFDHAALLKLSDPSWRGKGRAGSRGSEGWDGGDSSLAGESAAEAITTQQPVRFPLRLLIGIECANATVSGLARALYCFPNLVFLDLSQTVAARDKGVLGGGLAEMKSLQVLKLRALGLRDDELRALAGAIRTRVRSLDVSDNKLTDEAVDVLLEKCFHHTVNVHAEQRRNARRQVEDADWPNGVPRSDDVIVFEEFKGADLDTRFIKRLTSGVVGRILSEDMPQTGITHLYIGGNYVTTDGLIKLVQTQNLHVLDASPPESAGLAIQTNRSRGRVNSMNGPSGGFCYDAERLAPVLEKHGENLTHLRIHHSLVTSPAALPEDDDVPPLAELSLQGAVGPRELDAPHRTTVELPADEVFRVELEAPPQFHELLTEGAPRYELEANPLPASFQKAKDKQKEKAKAGETGRLEEPGAKRDPVFAPEVVIEDGLEVEPTADYFEPPISPLLDAGPSTPRPLPSPSSPREVGQDIAKLEGSRKGLRYGVRDPSRGILPGLLSSLETLILTDVPVNDYSESGYIVRNLTQYINDCALEAHLALRQSQLEHPLLYVPGRPRSMHQRHRVSDLFALKRIVLEMAPQYSFGASLRPASSHSPSSSIHNFSTDSPDAPSTPRSPSWSYTTSKQPTSFVNQKLFRPGRSAFDQKGRSSTGDPDTEAFWRQQENDFTFFGEEECGLPARETSRFVPRSTFGEKMTVSTSGGGDDETLLSPLSIVRSVGDTDGSRGLEIVGELSRWRRARKEAAERVAGQGAGGKSGEFIEGFWKGEIKVIRPGLGPSRGYVDWYGNYFEKGVYR